MYQLSVKETLKKKFHKMEKREKRLLQIINKKVLEIRNSPYLFKPLRFPMSNLRRVHIDRNFVLVYSIDEQNKTVVLEDFDHHDNVYRK